MAVLAEIKGWPTEPTVWPSHLCWTNLFKVAPRDGGNPAGRLRNAQFPVATEMLAREVREFEPRRVLVLAGWSWFEPFGDGLKLSVERRDGAVEGIATDSGQRWVIAKHPERKPEDRAVREVVTALG